jgi:hypothetical protein
MPGIAVADVTVPAGSHLVVLAATVRGLLAGSPMPRDILYNAGLAGYTKLRETTDEERFL